jgi:hypothetical protein
MSCEFHGCSVRAAGGTAQCTHRRDDAPGLPPAP